MFLYKQYSQALLDEQYNNRIHVPDFSDYFDRWNQLSERARNKLPLVGDISYGELMREKLDIFPSSKPNSKTLIFIHGGYWQMLDKNMFSFIADSFHAYNITTVLINYPLAPEFSINQIVLSCTIAIEWVYKNISAFNGDPGELYLVGHSAGGHLTAMLMATDWKAKSADLPQRLFKGACAISGIFNLVPIQLSYLNKVLKIDSETAFSKSPVTLKPLNLCPLIIAVGGDETAEFNEQSKDLYSVWKDEGIDASLLVLPHLNHYSIIENFADPHSNHHQALKELMHI